MLWEGGSLDPLKIKKFITSYTHKKTFINYLKYFEEPILMCLIKKNEEKRI